MKIRIKQMTLQNFKKVRNLTVNFDPESNTIISGANGTGKTTIYDAYLWCIFGKTSGTNSIVQVLDRDNRIMHKIDTVVTLVLDIDGEYDVTLQRKFAEKWKAAGTPEEEYVGNEMQRYFNEVPVSKKEYEAKLSNICNLESWLLLSNIGTFMEQKMDDRRKMLMEIAGKVNEEELMKPYPSIQQAAKENKSLDELAKQTKSIRKRSNEEFLAIPQKISAQDALRVDCDFDALRKQKETIEKQISDLDTLLQGSSEELAADKEYRKTVSEVQGLLDKKRTELANAHSKQLTEAISKLGRLQNNLFAAEKEARIKEEVNKQRIQTLAELQGQFEELRNKRNEVNGRAFEFTDMELCPVCGRPFTDDMKADKRNHAEEEFNLKKSSELDQLEKDGVELYNRITALKGVVNEYRDIVKPQLDNAVEQAGNAVKEAITVKDALTSYDVDREPAVIELSKRLEELKSNAPKHEQDTSKEANIAKKNELMKQRDEIISALSGEQTNSRIEEEKEKLNRRSEELSQIINDCDRVLYEVHSYKKSKIEAVENSVNGFFKLARWKFYEKNLTNEDEKEICTCTYLGVDYDNKNTADQINLGIDIINGLGKAKDISVPLFLDRAESVNPENLLIPDCQLIAIKVTEENKLNVSQF